MRHSLPATATTLRPLGALAVLFWLAACSNTTATHGTTASVMPRDTGASYEETTYEEAVDDNDDDTFEVASSADEEELSKQRGGFIFAGGLKIDFGLATTTAINGIIQSSLNLNTSNLNGALPKSLGSGDGPDGPGDPDDIDHSPGPGDNPVQYAFIRPAHDGEHHPAAGQQYPLGGSQYLYHQYQYDPSGHR